MNFFRTHKHTHKIPNMVMRHALVLSPNKDWTDPETEAYQYLKKWALNQDELRGGGKVEAPEPADVFIMDNDEYAIPAEVMEKALELSQGKGWKDKRTKAYKYIEAWALEQDKSYEE